MPTWLEFRGLLIAWLIITGIGSLVAISLWLVTQRAKILPPQRRRAVPWTGPLVLLALIVFIFFPSFIIPYIDAATVGRWAYGPAADPDAAEKLRHLVATLIALPLQVVTWRALALLVDGPRIVFGLVPRRLAADFQAAFRMWLWLTPLVYLFNFAAVELHARMAHRPPDEHPLVQMLQDGRPTINLVVLVFLQAVVVAPIREEIFFRGILQPFFAEREWGGPLAIGIAIVLGVVIHGTRPVTVADPMAVALAAAPALFALAMLPIMVWIDAWPQRTQLPVRDPQVRRQASAAVVGTALLFANCHANVWPTPIPLFVLALGLGWLAYRTQSVVAPIFLHMLFNSIVFLAIPPPPV